MSSTTTALGLSGVITIQTAKDTTPHTVTLDGTETLMGLRDKINASGAQVQADVITVINGGTTTYQLKITSKVLGSDGTITMSDDKGGALLADAKLNLQSAPGVWVKPQAPTDAVFKLDGNDYVMSTNEISGVIPGLSLTLKKPQDPASSSLSLKVTYDAKPTVTAIQDWAKAINDTISLVKTESQYKNGDTPAGNLAGESLCRSIEQNLRSKFSLVYGSLPSSMNTLSQAGITTGAWKSDDYGKLLVDADKLTEQLNKDPDAVAKLFGAGTPDAPGVASDMYSYVNGLLAFQKGDIDTKNDTLSTQIKQTADRISDMTTKLSQRETELRAQFTRMEVAMSKLQTQGNAFLSQINGMLGNTNNK
jgi:flagellar hook-associated protein 2